MTSRFQVGLVQLTSSDEMAANIETASDFIREAKARGADLVLTPETTSLMAKGARDTFAKTTSQDDDPALAAFRALAAELECWLLIGSLPIQLTPEQLANRSFLLDPTGKIAARYDKIHMFDVNLASGERHHESKIYRPGEEAVLAPLPWGTLGLTICYDLRFPYLYRDLASAGADFLTVPSAFTRITGQAHWHTLLQARAIETGCYVFAPGQCGDHANGRQTFGHSLVVAPWGEILADGGTGPGVVMAEIDPQAVAVARGKVPALEHGRAYAPAVPAADLAAK